MFDISLTGKSVRITIERDIFETMGPVAVVNEAKNIMEYLGLMSFDAVVDENFKPKKATTAGRVTCVFDYTPAFYTREFPVFDIMRAIKVTPSTSCWHIKCPHGSVVAFDNVDNKFLSANIKGEYREHEFNIGFYKSTAPMVGSFISSNIKVGDEVFEIDELTDPLHMLIEKDTPTDSRKQSHLVFRSRPVFVGYKDYMYVDCGRTFDAKSEIVIEFSGKEYPASIAWGSILRISKELLTPTYADIKADTVMEAYSNVAALVPTNAIAVHHVAPDSRIDWFTKRGGEDVSHREAELRFYEHMLVEAVGRYVTLSANMTQAILHETIDKMVENTTHRNVWNNYRAEMTTPDLMGSPLSSVNRQVRQPIPDNGRGIASPAAVYEAIAHYLKNGRYGCIADAFADITDALISKREWARHVNREDLMKVSDAFKNLSQIGEPMPVAPGTPLADMMIATIRDIIASTPVYGLRSRINVSECIDILTDIDQHIRSEVMKTPIAW